MNIVEVSAKMANNSNLYSNIHNPAGYDSEFDIQSDVERKKRKHEDLARKEKKKKVSVKEREETEQDYDKHTTRLHYLTMDAYSRHKMLVNNYMAHKGGLSAFKRDTSRDKTDFDIIRENHKFLWSEEDDNADTWEKRMAKKYYDKLFREYCIADLSRYKENKVGMRWRVEKEVVEGKGQFVCGNKKCMEKEGLRSWEINFGYMEQGEKKNALIKLRMCPDCSYKLNYHNKKKEVLPKTKKKDKKQHQSECEDNGDYDRKSSGGKSEPSSKEKVNGKDKEDNSDKKIWGGPAKISEDKSKEEEFDEYFEDMFL